MKVYVVTSCPIHGATEVEGVFSSSELAMVYMAGWHVSYGMEWHERTVDAATAQAPGVAGEKK